jgi:hypothetical protein
MTRDEAEAKLVARYPFMTDQDRAGILDGTDEERKAIGVAYALAGIGPDMSFWSVFIEVCEALATVAGVVSGVSSAISAVYGLKSL